MRAAITTVLDLAGAAAVTTGAALIYAPAGFVVGGVLVLAASWHMAPRTATQSTPEELVQ